MNTNCPIKHYFETRILETFQVLDIVEKVLPVELTLHFVTVFAKIALSLGLSIT